MLSEKDFKEIWDKYYVRMICFAKTYSDRDDVCQDIVVDAFVIFWQKYDGVGNMDVFLVTMIRNKCIDYMRSLKSVKVIGEDHLDVELPDEQISFIEANVISGIYKEIELLPKRQKKVLICYLEGMATGDISNHLKLSTQTVLNVKGKVLKKFKKIFNQ